MLHAHRAEPGSDAARFMVLRAALKTLGDSYESDLSIPRHLTDQPVSLSDELLSLAEASLLAQRDAEEPLAFRMGRMYQQLMEWTVGPDLEPLRIGRRERRAVGAFYTPLHLVDRVADLALGALSDSRGTPSGIIRVCDPACGSGNFLTRMSAKLSAAGCEFCVEGCDIDPIACWIARSALMMERVCPQDAIKIRCGDSLVGVLDGCEHDPERASAAANSPLQWSDRHDIVIGNPPFLGQLARGTARSRSLAEYLRHASRGVITGYADSAAAFVWRAVMLCRPQGIIALIVPRSLLASRDAAPLRRFVGEHAKVLGIEPIDDVAFDAGVQPCILLLRRSDKEAKVSADANASGIWSMNDAATIDRRTLDSAQTLSSICSATADFRDAYYGLAPFIMEDESGTLDDSRFPRLITSGMIEPGRTLWGIKQCRIFKRFWLRPRIDLHALQADETMAAWARKRLVPKILVATQTRSIECVADESGRWLPVTPVISVYPREGVPLTRIMHSLCSPQASLTASIIAQGTGMSASVFRLAARQIGQIPLIE
ncbi:MAG: SAM-dependent DNA methyltransferase [Phycisphaeraceae bacterium]|nr:SAM-dependent DNA methyltransferase [Phycisphaeraceae bacterium]